MSQPAATTTSADLLRHVIDEGEVRGRQLTIVLLCLFFNMLDGFDITAMAVVAGAIGDDLALGPQELGWIFSSALAGMMLGAMLLAPVSDIVGRRSLVIASLVLVGFSILLTARAGSFAEIVALRFASGVGAGAMLASQAALAAEYSPERYRAAAVAIVTSGYPLGAMMTSVVAAWVMPSYGWRGMFWFGGGLTIAMVLVAWLYIPESLKYLLQRRPRRAVERINRILEDLGGAVIDRLPAPDEPSAEGGPGFVRGMRMLTEKPHRKSTLTLWAAFFLLFSTLYFLMSWIPKLMEDAGYDSATGRQAFFLFNLGGVLGIYLLSWLSTRWKLSTVMLVLSMLAAVAMIVFAVAPGDLSLMLGLILAIGITQQGAFTGLYSAAAKVYPTAIRSTGIGWGIGLGRLGAVAGPAVAGYLIAAGFGMSANFYFFALPMAIGGLIAYRLHLR
jgi:AAHS family 4-hydroxybenzoate transporter-like MFS transporter